MTKYLVQRHHFQLDDYEFRVGDFSVGAGTDRWFEISEIDWEGYWLKQVPFSQTIGIGHICAVDISEAQVVVSK